MGGIATGAAEAKAGAEAPSAATEPAMTAATFVSFIIEILFFRGRRTSAATVAPLSPWVTITRRSGNAYGNGRRTRRRILRPIFLPITGIAGQAIRDLR
ncbi:hypothetical protein GCM10017778_43890 [Streptomyces vinaceus]|nr:hypothetical protein GCM10017778_43890 [Streptomyces vinaceus]